ncbi:hypothetical protein QBC35DRAFT_482064 [Podospora australis]|uniref:Uncharacterized protein n=1 Tax=Podospora australis TaxID=1536484 RepID=A0AAN6X3W1_9PEZI|nr:hypothetical protein QBC35DRAFT_482064 [Podospora australis]
MDRYLGPPRYSNEADIITIGQYDSLHNPPPKYVAPVGYLSDIKFRKGLNSSVSSAVTGRMGELMERETQPLKWPWGRQHCTNHTTNNNNNNNNNHNNTHNNTPPPPQQQPEERVRNREKKGKGKEIDHRKSTSSSSSSSNNSNSKRKEREEGDRGKGKGRQERMPESPAYKRRKENGGYHRPTVEDWDDAEQEEEEEQDL